MNLEELAEYAKLNKPAVEEEEFEKEDDRESDLEEDLNNALSLMEDCEALLAALTDPKKRSDKYLQRQIVKIGEEINGFLGEFAGTDEEGI